MALMCPPDLDRARLRAEIMAIYGQVATSPEGDFHFHRGPAYAAERLGYDPHELALLPGEATASFAGVGNPLSIDPLVPGDTVVDIGCGAGMDLLLAARRLGPGGTAIGVDMTDAMLARAQRAADQAGLACVTLRKGDAGALPVDDAGASVIISNGVLNLAPDKSRAFGEIHRVLAPGGRLLLADIIVADELSEGIRQNIDLWTG